MVHKRRVARLRVVLLLLQVWPPQTARDPRRALQPQVLFDRNVERGRHGLTVRRVVDTRLRVCRHEVVQLASELAEGLLLTKLVLLVRLLLLGGGVVVEVPVRT